MKIEVGSARYGARSAPKAFSVLRDVEPTRIGISGGNAASLGKLLCTCLISLAHRRSEYGYAQREHLVNVRQVHLEAVLVFILRSTHM